MHCTSVPIRVYPAAGGRFGVVGVMDSAELLSLCESHVCQYSRPEHQAHKNKVDCSFFGLKFNGLCFSCFLLYLSFCLFRRVRLALFVRHARLVRLVRLAPLATLVLLFLFVLLVHLVPLALLALLVLLVLLVVVVVAAALDTLVLHCFCYSI